MVIAPGSFLVPVGPVTSSFLSYEQRIAGDNSYEPFREMSVRSDILT